MPFLPLKQNYLVRPTDYDYIEGVRQTGRSPMGELLSGGFEDLSRQTASPIGFGAEVGIPALGLPFLGQVRVKYPKSNLYKALMESGRLEKPTKLGPKDFAIQLREARRVKAKAGRVGGGLLEEFSKKYSGGRVSPANAGPLGLYRPSTGEALYSPQRVKEAISNWRPFITEPHNLERYGKRLPKAMTAKAMHRAVVMHEVTHPKTLKLSKALEEGLLGTNPSVYPKVNDKLLEVSSMVKQELSQPISRFTKEINRLQVAAGFFPAQNAVADSWELTNNITQIYNSPGGRAILDTHPVGKAYRELFDEMLITPIVKGGKP